MIRKWQGNQPGSRQPTGDAARRDSVRQGFAGGRGGQYKRLVAVRLFQRFKPASPMERRSARMAIDQVIPARIGEWIDDVQWYCASPSVEIKAVAAKRVNRGKSTSRIFKGERASSSLLYRCRCPHRGWRRRDRLFHGIAERMPHQDVALLNARRFV